MGWARRGRSPGSGPTGPALVPVNEVRLASSEGAAFAHVEFEVPFAAGALRVPPRSRVLRPLRPALVFFPVFVRRRPTRRCGWRLAGTALPRKRVSAGTRVPCERLREARAERSRGMTRAGRRSAKRDAAAPRKQPLRTDSPPAAPGAGAAGQGSIPAAGPRCPRTSVEVRKRKGPSRIRPTRCRVAAPFRRSGSGETDGRSLRAVLSPAPRPRSCGSGARSRNAVQAFLAGRFSAPRARDGRIGRRGAADRHRGRAGIPGSQAAGHGCGRNLAELPAGASPKSDTRFRYPELACGEFIVVAGLEEAADPP